MKEETEKALEVILNLGANWQIVRDETAALRGHNGSDQAVTLSEAHANGEEVKKAVLQAAMAAVYTMKQIAEQGNKNDPLDFVHNAIEAFNHATALAFSDVAGSKESNYLEITHVPPSIVDVPVAYRKFKALFLGMDGEQRIRSLAFAVAYFAQEIQAEALHLSQTAKRPYPDPPEANAKGLPTISTLSSSWDNVQSVAQWAANASLGAEEAKRLIDINYLNEPDQ